VNVAVPLTKGAVVVPDKTAPLGKGGSRVITASSLPPRALLKLLRKLRPRSNRDTCGAEEKGKVAVSLVGLTEKLMVDGTPKKTFTLTGLVAASEPVKKST